MMRVSVIRAGGRLSVRTDAGAIEPRLDVTYFPDSLAGALGIALSFAISALRVLGPVQRQALAHKPFAEISAADRTGRDRAAIWVEVEGRAVNRTPGDKSIKVVCGLRATTVLQTVLAAAELAALRRVDTPKPNADSMNFQGVAINDAGLTDKIIGQRAAREQKQNQYQYSALDHCVGGLRLSHIARIEFRPVLERLERWQIFGPLGIVKLRATQPAPLEAIPEQDGVHLPGELIDPPDTVVLNHLARRIERKAVQATERVNFIPVFPDVAVLQRNMVWPVGAPAGSAATRIEALARHHEFGNARDRLADAARLIRR